MNFDYKRLLPAVLSPLIFFMLLFIYTRLAGPIPFSVNSVTTNKSDSFAVTGEGKASIKPDLANVTVGVTATGPTVKAAQDQLNTAINKVSSGVKGLGVEQKDIQTTNYNINPEYDFRSGTQQIRGYIANTNLSIKVRDIDKANQVLDSATSNGANVVGGISFEASDKTKGQNEAREKAVADAKQKAEQAARIAGFNLGKIINYSENFGGDFGPRPMVMNMAKDAGGAEQSTQVEPGSTDITVNVTLQYEVR